MDPILESLLERLAKRQSWCPWCDREYGHENDCQISDAWNRIAKKLPEDTDLSDSFWDEQDTS